MANGNFDWDTPAELPGKDEEWTLGQSQTVLGFLQGGDRGRWDVGDEVPGETKPFDLDWGDNTPWDTLDPTSTARSLKGEELSHLPQQPDEPKLGLLGPGARSYIAQRYEQGLIQSSINRLGYDGAIRKIDRKELRARKSELESQLPFKEEEWNTAWYLDKLLGTGAEILGQMTRTLSRGVAGALGAAPLGALGGPLAAVTVPGAAAAGATFAVLDRSVKENTGALYLQLIGEEYAMYRSLEDPTKFLSQEEFDRARRFNENYTKDMGYTPEMVEIPDSLAVPLALTFGSLMGGVELLKINTLVKAVGGVNVFQGMSNRAVRRLIQGKGARAYVADLIARWMSLGAIETGQEILQDSIGFFGSELAIELNEEIKGRYHMSAEERQSFFAGWAKQAYETGQSIGPAMFFLGGLGTATGAIARLPGDRAAAKAKEEAQRIKADGDTSYWFNQETGENVDINDIAVEEGELLERDNVKAVAILEQAKESNLTLPPIVLSVRTDGSLFAEDAMSAAYTKVMRDAGMSSLRAVKVDKTKGLTDSKQAAELFSDDPIKAGLVGQFPNDTVAEIKAKVLLLQLAASRDGVTLNDWYGQYFQEDGMFPQVAPSDLGIPDPTPEPGVEALPPTPTIDGALWDSPGPIVDVTATMDVPTTPRTESSYVSIEPTIPGAPTIAPGFLPAAPDAPADPAVDIPEGLDEPSVEAAQHRVRIGETMSSKTYLAKVEADAEAAGDEFLAQAARNVVMDKFEAIEGDVMTPAEHTVEVMPDLIEESGRLETESIRLRRSTTQALWKQRVRERKEAAMAAELEPTDPAAPEITDIEEPEIELEEPAVEEMAHPVVTVSRTDLRPAFNTRIPAEAGVVIYQDMDDNFAILSGLMQYNASGATASQEVSGTMLRAEDGVTLEEAQQYAVRAGALAGLPESVPVARDAEEEVVLIKSDGETVGAVEFDENSKAIVRAYDSMDTKSWLHSLVPVFRKMLPARETAVAARWAGAKHSIGTDGRVRWTWDDASNYKFASGFTQYLQEGKVSFPELQPIWKNLSDWTKASYAVNRTRLTKPIRDIYESFLVDERSPSLKAYQANRQMVGQVADMTFRSPTSATVLRLKASEGRSLLMEEGGGQAPSLVFVEALDTDGNVLTSREYKDVDSAVRDISGVPTADNPATVGDASYGPHAAKQGPVSGFYGAVPIGDVLPPDAGPEGAIFVGGKPVDSNKFIGDVIRRLDESGQMRMREGFVPNLLASWRRYDYATELLAAGVEGPLFQVLSRDLDKGRWAEKSTRLDLNDIQRNKLLQRGWTQDTLRKLPDRMKEKVEVSGWKHRKAKDTWTIGDLLSFNRHLRAGQNRVTLLERGFRDGPDGDLIRVDEEDIATLIRAYTTIPAELRDFGEGVVDELMDIIHEKMDPVHRKSRRRALGYVPHYWDLERADQDRSPEMIKEELENADALDLWRDADDPKMGVFEGMTHHRTRNSAPIVLRPLDFQIMRNVDRASMYVGFELPLKAARQLFVHPQARAAMERRMGKSAVKGLEQGLQGVARRWVDESFLDKKLQVLQRNITVSTLALNIPVWFKQTLSLPLYGSYVPAKYMAASLTRSSIPGQLKQMKKQLSSVDPTFMTRSKGGFDISLQDTLENSAAREAWGKRRVTDVAMKGLTYFDQRTVTIGSHAAYLQAINEFRTGNLSEELKRATQLTAAQARELTADQAVEYGYEYANWVTVRSQPNFLPEHVSSFQRNRGTRLFSMFSGYTNVAYNMLLRTLYRARMDKSPQAYAAMAKTFLWIYIGNATGNAVINYLKQLWLGTAPEPEELPSWIADQYISNAASHIYFLNDAIFALRNDWADYDMSPVFGAGKDTIDALGDVYRDMQEGELRESTVNNVLRVAGFARGYPLETLLRYGSATADRLGDLDLEDLELFDHNIF